MSRPIWVDPSGNQHYVDELSDAVLLSSYDFIQKWIGSLNEKLAASWALTEFIGSGPVAEEAYEGIAQLDEEIIKSVQKFNSFKKEIKDRGLQL